jgi:hypothetical protein
MPKILRDTDGDDEERPSRLSHRMPRKILRVCIGFDDKVDEDD